MAVKSTPIGAAKIGPAQSIAVAEPQYRKVVLSRDWPRPGPRGYPRHARSLSARAMRQRMLLIAAVLAAAAISSVVVGPRIFSGISSVGRPDPRRAAPGPSPGQIAAAAARAAAARWIHQWVAANADIACDPVMCQALMGHGIAGERLLQLDPSATDPLGADVVVATLTIRAQFGPRLARVYAPAVLASFGAGAAKVDVRVVANGTDYLRALRSDVSARKVAGAALLRNPKISARGPAAHELAAGEVDSRLLANLVALIDWGCPVSVLSFGGRGPGSTAGMPLLSADITPMVGGRGMRLDSGRSRAEMDAAMDREVSRIVRFLNSQITPLRPASFTNSHGTEGRMVVQVDFTAPVQFGVFDGTPIETDPISAPER
jgi:hypothetical protein